MSGSAGRKLTVVGLVFVIALGAAGCSSPATNGETLNLTVSNKTWSAAKAFVASPDNDGLVSSPQQFIWISLCEDGDTATNWVAPVPHVVGINGDEVKLSVHLSSSQLAMGNAELKKQDCPSQGIHTVAQDYASATSAAAVNSEVRSIQSIKNSTTTTSTTTTTPLTCVQIPYGEMVKNEPSDKGRCTMITGTVFQYDSLTGSDAMLIQLDSSDVSGAGLVELSITKTQGAGVVEGDTVSVTGIYNGVTTYKTGNGSTNTVPVLVASHLSATTSQSGTTGVTGQTGNSP
jgi:hypothetical protein